MENAKMASAYLLREKITGEQELLEQLKALSEIALDKNNIVMAFDEARNYYTSTKKKGKWTNREIVDSKWETQNGISTPSEKVLSRHLILWRRSGNADLSGEGMGAHIAKPFEVPALMETLSNLLGKK